MNWPVFFKRTASALVYAAIMLTGLLYPDPYAIIVLALLIQFLCLREFLTLMEQAIPGLRFSVRFREGVQLLGLWSLIGLIFFQTHLAFMLLPVPLLILLPAVLSKQSRLKEACVALAGLLYVCLPMASLVTMRGLSYTLPVALVLMIWVNDTMAYITGSFFGKTPFSPISPKKTWEGTIGGALFTLAGAAVWAYYSPFSQLHWPVWMGLAVIAVVAGTAGDLLASKLKRLAKVKDSGNIMPGHGGALDRFDSLLAALPFALCFIAWFGL